MSKEMEEEVWSQYRKYVPQEQFKVIKKEFSSEKEHEGANEGKVRVTLKRKAS